MEKGKLSLEFDHGETDGSGNIPMEVFSLLRSQCEQVAHALFLEPLNATVECAFDLVWKPT